MGKKYIIELLDECNSKFKGIMALGLTQEQQISVELIPEESLTPYTEPDMEQVREEAYEQGLSDARDEKATCQYCRHTDKGSSEEPCKTCCMNYHNKFEPEEQITKGDIVRIKSTPEVEILVTYADEEYVSGIALTEVDGNCEIGDQYTNIRISNVEKTGKHYDIVSVLQKMREESNG